MYIFYICMFYLLKYICLHDFSRVRNNNENLVVLKLLLKVILL